MRKMCQAFIPAILKGLTLQIGPKEDFFSQFDLVILLSVSRFALACNSLNGGFVKKILLFGKHAFIFLY
jgi:hypothetical protein